MPDDEPLARTGADGDATFDLAVVGGGIVGLACAAELALRHPTRRVVVLERERTLAAHQTGHNSGVIHAGVYYEPGSLKARLCTEGARLMYAFCDEHGVAAERVGKLIVARDQAEVPGLRAILERGRRNGVRGLRWLEGREIAAVEPNAVGVAAVHSPQTGITDYTAVTERLADLLRSRGGEVVTGVRVDGVAESGRALRLSHARGSVTAGHVLFCAGGWSDRLAVMAGASPDPRIIPFRGAYLLAEPARRDLVRGLIYPVPDPALPFLGVHLTRHVDGSLSVGPTAMLALSLRSARGLHVDPAVARRTLAWRGTLPMAWRYRRAALAEIRAALRPQAIASAAQDYVPALRGGVLTPGPVGVRAQALARSGALVEDFVFSRTPRALHVRNAPSPAATSALAIARHVCEEFARAFALPPPSRKVG